MHKFGLIVDLKNRKLIDSQTKLFTKGEITEVIHTDSLSTIQNSSRFYTLLKKYPEITKPAFLPKRAPHGVKHYINTENNAPVYSRARRIGPQFMQLVKQEFQILLDAGIVSPSKSQWASPVHLVEKKNGTWRVCGDYRRLNAITTPDRYPIPRIDDVNYILQGKTIFSTLDLVQAYYNIPMAECDKEKTALITPFGLFEFNFLPFGLRNAPSTFQRFMAEVLRSLDFCFCYLDDILIASQDEEEHERHLELIFNRLNEFGLQINVSKSVLCVKEVSFLGYLISAEGTKPDPRKVEAIVNFKRPETLQQLRTFIGMINFYRSYIKDAAQKQATLNNFLRGAKKKDQSKVPWTEEAIKQFEACKTELANSAMLAIPNQDLPLAIFTDASNYAVGAVVQQYEAKGWRPLGFFFKEIK